MSTVVPPILKEPTPIMISPDELSNATVADSAKAFMQKMIEYTNKLDFASMFQYYSDDPNARYVENGFLYPSLTAMKENYNVIVQTMEFLENTVKSWDIMVLSNDAAFVTLPIHARIKAKGCAEYQFDYVWSILVQKRNEKWLIVQTHESWVNPADVITAITPQ